MIFNRNKATEQQDNEPKTANLFSDVAYTAEQEYGELLSRADNPQPNDAKRLTELLPLLGMTLREAQSDFSAIKSVRYLENLVAGEQASTEKVNRTGLAYRLAKDAYEKWNAEKLLEVNKLQNEHTVADVELRQLLDHKTKMQTIKARHPRVSDKE